MSTQKKTSKVKYNLVLFEKLSIELINEKIRVQHFEKNRNKIESKWRTWLVMLKAGLEDPNCDLDSIHLFCRQMFGYGTFGNSGPIIGLFTENGINVNSTETENQLVNDHVFGCLLIAILVKKTFIESGYDIEYMINEWLPNNLYLWMVVRMTKDEHRMVPKFNKDYKKFLSEQYTEIIDTTFEYKYKLNLLHYSEISKVGFKNLESSESTDGDITPKLLNRDTNGNQNRIGRKKRDFKVDLNGVIFYNPSSAKTTYQEVLHSIIDTIGHDELLKNFPNFLASTKDQLSIKRQEDQHEYRGVCYSTHLSNTQKVKNINNIFEKYPYTLSGQATTQDL